MSTSSIEALASAWARIAEEATLPTGYEGTATPEAHRACEAIQAWIRDHIVATNDMRLFGLLHLLLRLLNLLHELVQRLFQHLG